MIDPKDSLPEILTTLKDEWATAVQDKKHPFRYVVLSTLGEAVMSRYVVLRQLEDDLGMIIYTDHRSRKVSQIQAQPQVQLLFYHAQKGVQVMVAGRAEIHYQNALTEAHWQHVQGNGRKAYNTQLAPGKAIASPAEGHEWMDGLPDNHFTVIRVKPVTIEVLQLNKSEHIRAVYHASNAWEGQWLVP